MMLLFLVMLVVSFFIQNPLFEKSKTSRDKSFSVGSSMITTTPAQGSSTPPAQGSSAPPAQGSSAPPTTFTFLVAQN